METGTYEREREALRAVLTSPEISRSPNLTRVLVYLCDKYFAGESSEVKEYHVALEALGRPPDFDQKKDSIVRVEMHRLRRRLKEYHIRTAATTGLQLHIPEKSYTPAFICLDAAPLPEVPRIEPLPVEISAPPVAVVVPSRRFYTPLALSLLLVATAIGLFLIRRSPSSVSAGAKADMAVDAPAVVPNPPAGDEIRLLCGRPPGLYVDRYGQTWDGDRYTKGGEAVQVQAAVMTSGFDRNVFHSMRVGHHRYDIPLKPGVYQMELLFAETEYGDGNPLEGGELSRPFRVLVNDKVVVDDLDIIAETVEPNVATSRIVTDLSPASDGMLHIEFQAISTGEPFVNAIILRPGIPGKLLPLRMICRTHRYRDSKGRLWEPDHYFRGGSTIVRPTTPGVPEGEIFRGERYGKFTYSIPVLLHEKYQATVYLWESWLGAGRPGAGGLGSRVFSIHCNLLPLLQHYDLIADSGPEQLKIKTFRNLEPDRNGKLVFQFDAEANKALLNAIEIVDQSLTR